MEEKDIGLENIDLNIISRINDSVDLSDADKKLLIKLVMVKGKTSIDVDKVKAQAREQAIRDYKLEHAEFIDRIKKETVKQIIRLIEGMDSDTGECFVYNHQIDAKELVKKITKEFLEK